MSEVLSPEHFVSFMALKELRKGPILKVYYRFADQSEGHIPLMGEKWATYSMDVPLLYEEKKKLMQLKLSKTAKGREMILLLMQRYIDLLILEDKKRGLNADCIHFAIPKTDDDQKQQFIACPNSSYFARRGGVGEIIRCRFV